MEKIFEFEHMEFTEKEWNKLAENVLDPILLNQYPFVHPGMTVGDYFIEKKYREEHYENPRTYKPLWKQEELREEILQQYEKKYGIKLKR